MRIYNSGEKQESRDEEPSKDSCYYAENDKVVLKRGVLLCEYGVLQFNFQSNPSRLFSGKVT